MSGRHSFSKLRERLLADPEQRRKMDEEREAYGVLLRLSELAELRRERGVTQTELAKALDVSQAAVSKVERAAASDPDAGAVHLSTLAGYVEALGGRLELRATFPEHHETDVAVPIGAAATEDEVPDGQGPLGTRED